MAFSDNLNARLAHALKDQGAANELEAAVETAEGLSATELGFLDGVVAGAGAASKALVLDASNDLTLPDGSDIAVNATTGTKIGTAVTQKLGFWNATPIVQPLGAAQAALNAYGAGANGFDSGPNASALHALVVAMRVALVNAGIMKGGA